MTPQLTKIAECLSESHAREIKLARCLAESLKRIQTLESSAKTKDTKAKATELRFNAAVRELSEHCAKRTAENDELIRKMEEAIKVEFPAQLAALKAEFATPAAQAAAPQSFNPRGAYEPGEKYKPFDYVSSNGSSYIALVENPTQPPSKKSKQWMLVAARGAGGGGVTGLGTAATRDVGQAAGNVLELSELNTVTIGDGFSPSGQLSLTGPDGIVFVKNESGLLTFADSTGTATLEELARLSQVGDRYLTSSTTSNTVSNGAKTFTIGTGLAYTPTQDITIVFNAGNHMHCSVTSYNSGTGVLVVDVNSHTGSGTYAVWTVNVGGIGAGAIPSGGTTGQVLAKVSNANYDDAWVTPTVAVDGVTGLGTGVATALAVNAGSAGAFVRTTDTATTTTAGVVPGIGGTVLTNVTDYLSLVYRHRIIPVTAQTFTNAGTFTGQVGGEPSSMRYGGVTGATPFSTLRFYPNNVGNSLQGALHDVDSNSRLNFSARWSFTFQFSTDQQHANATTYFMLGIAAGTAYGAPATKSVGLRVVNGTGVGFAHDGTTLNVSSTIGTFNNFVSNVLTIENMGTGTINFYFNGVLSVTMTNGPTGMSANSGETFVVAFTNGATATSNRAFIYSASALRMN